MSGTTTEQFAGSRSRLILDRADLGNRSLQGARQGVQQKQTALAGARTSRSVSCRTSLVGLLPAFDTNSTWWLKAFEARAAASLEQQQDGCRCRWRSLAISVKTPAGGLIARSAKSNGTAPGSPAGRRQRLEQRRSSVRVSSTPTISTASGGRPHTASLLAGAARSRSRDRRMLRLASAATASGTSPGCGTWLSATESAETQSPARRRLAKGW